MACRGRCAAISHGPIRSQRWSLEGECRLQQLMGTHENDLSSRTDVGLTASPRDGPPVRTRRSPLGDYLRGAALIFDFTGSLSRRRISTMRYATDADALAADWDVVGADLASGHGPAPAGTPYSVTEAAWQRSRLRFAPGAGSRAGQD